jgi:hypothetical protein
MATTDTDTNAQAEALKPPEKTKRLPLPGEQIPLTDAERATLYSELSQYYTECAWPETEVQQRAKDWKEYNCATPVATRLSPIMTFDGKGHSANIRLPLVRSMVDAWKAQVSESVFAERPFYACEPGLDPSDAERADEVEGYYDNAIEHLMRYPRIVDELDTRVGIEGTGIIHLPMVREEKFTLERAMPDDDGVLQQGGQWKVAYHGVKPEVVQIDRFRLYPQDARSIEDAYAVFHETWITRDALDALRKQKKAVITDEQWKAMTDGDDGDRVAEETASPSSGATVSHKHRFRVVYAWMPYKTKAMDRAMPFVFAFLVNHNVCYSATPSNTGHVRPFVSFRALDTGKPFLGLPIPRVIEHCLEVTNTRMNQMINHTTAKHYLAQSPFFTPANDFDLNQPWLGRPVPVSELGGIKYIDIGADFDAIPQIQFFLELIERFTGINSNALGVPMPNNKTATEVNSMNTQGSKIFRLQIEMLNMSHVEVAETIATQMYLNGPNEISYLVPVSQSEQQRMLAEAQDAAMAEMTATAEEEAAMSPMPPVPEMDPMQTGMAMMGQGMNVPPPPPDPALGDSGAMGGLPEEPPMPDVPPPPRWKVKTILAQAFAPGLKFSVRGSGAHLNRAEEVQEAIMLRETLIEDPLVLVDGVHLWELDNRLMTALRIPNPEAFIGEKPEPGVSVPQLMAQAMPPQPVEPEPVPPPVDNTPKVSIAMAFSDLPADAQGGLLELIGLPAEGAYAGETAPPDPMALEQMKLDAKVAVAKAAPKPNGNGAAPDSSPVGDGPEMEPMGEPMMEGF